MDEIIDFAELEAFRDVPVRTYSSGMYMRLGFSVAMHVQPDVLLLDEVLAVGDEAFQQKCYAKIWEFKRSGGTIVFVSHDPAAVENVCERAILLEHGRCSGPSGRRGGGTPPTGGNEARRRRAWCTATETGRAATACTRCGRSPATAPSATASRKASRWPSRSGSYADEGLEDGRVTVGIRDSSGVALGSQRTDGVRLRPATLERLRLHFPGLPMREGRFSVDVVVGTQDGGWELAYAERALELSVFSQDTSGGGPVRLGGTWELPAGDGPDT